MSYMREGCQLKFFNDSVSDQYVYGNGDYIETYGTLHTASNECLVELCGRFVHHIEFEHNYDHRCTYELISELAKRLGISHKLKSYKEIYNDKEQYIEGV